MKPGQGPLAQRQVNRELEAKLPEWNPENRGTRQVLRKIFSLHSAASVEKDGRCCDAQQLLQFFAGLLYWKYIHQDQWLTAKLSKDNVVYFNYAGFCESAPTTHMFCVLCL